MGIPSHCKLAIKYFFYLLLFTAAVCKCVDLYLKYQSSPDLSNLHWEEENKRITKEMNAKYDANFFDGRNFPLLVTQNGLGSFSQSKTKPRILTLADSFSYGDGLANLNHTWWRQLSRELFRRGYDVEVIGMGRNGASTANELKWMQHPRFQDLNPDLILMGYVTNDPDMGMVCQGNLKRLRIFDKLFKSWLPELTERFQAGYSAKYRGDDKCYPYALWELKLLEGENFRRYENCLQELGQTLQNTPAPYLMVTLPNSPQSPDYFHERYAKVLPAIEAAGIPLLDLLGEFSLRHGADKVPPLYWMANPANGHPGAPSTQFYALQIADYLEQHHADLLGPKSKPSLIPKINDTHPFIPLTQQSPVIWQWRWPSKKDMAVMPLAKKHVELAFENPVPLLGIKPVTGNISAAYATVTDAHGLDDGKLYEIPFDGKGFQVPQLPTGALVNTLRLIPGDGDEVSVELTFAPELPL